MEKYTKTAIDALRIAFESEGVPYTEKGVRVNIDKWKANKQTLVHSLEKHPQWRPEELAVVGTFTETRRVSKGLVGDILEDIVRYASEYITDEDAKDAVRDAFINSRGLLFEKNIKEGAISEVDTEKWLVKPSQGMKSSRFVLKTLEAAGASMDKNEALRAKFTQFADAVSPYSKELDFTLSVNPGDYALMSNGRSWSSCHRIHGGDGPGEYASGTLSYMVDSSTMVFTVLEKVQDREPGSMFLEKKLYRQMILMHPDGKLFVQSRLYPGSSSQQDICREVRRIIHEIMSAIHGFENSWAAPHRGSHKSAETLSNLHYPDYQYFSSLCRTSIILPEKEALHEGKWDETIPVGGHPACITCGEHDMAGSGYMHCRYCEKSEVDYYEGSGYHPDYEDDDDDMW